MYWSVIIVLVVMISIYVGVSVWIVKTRGERGSAIVLILLLIFLSVLGIAYGITRTWSKKSKKINKK
jgi:fatty-acid desaturase